MTFIHRNLLSGTLEDEAVASTTNLRLAGALTISDWNPGTGNVIVVVATTPADTNGNSEYEILHITGVVGNNGLTVVRGREGTTAITLPVGTRLANNITAEQLQMLRGVLDVNLVPKAGSNVTIGSATSKVKQVYTEIANISGQTLGGVASGANGADPNIILPTNGGTLITTRDTAEEHVGTFSGQLGINSKGGNLPSTYPLTGVPATGDQRGDVLYIIDYSGVAGETAKIICQSRDILLNQVFPNMAGSGEGFTTTFTYNDTSITILDITISAASLPTGSWHTMTFTIPSGTALNSRAKLETYLATRTVGTYGFDPKGSLAIGGNLYVDDNADLRGDLLLKGELKHNDGRAVMVYNKANAPTATDDVDAGYKQGDLWFSGGALFWCSVNTAGSALWLRTNSVWQPFGSIRTQTGTPLPNNTTFSDYTSLVFTSGNTVNQIAVADFIQGTARQVLSVQRSATVTTSNQGGSTTLTATLTASFTRQSNTTYDMNCPSVSRTYTYSQSSGFPNYNTNTTTRTYNFGSLSGTIEGLRATA